MSIMSLMISRGLDSKEWLVTPIIRMLDLMMAYCPKKWSEISSKREKLPSMHHIS